MASEPEQVTRVRAILDSLGDLYAKKRADYGDSFTCSMDRWGVASARPRISDKVERFYTLCERSAAVSDESIADTLRDLALYAVMIADWIEQQPNDAG